MVQLKAGLAIVEVEDGRVLLDTRRGVYWHLNLPALTLIEELGRGRPFDDLIRGIAAETGTDEGTVRSDHLALVYELREAKLIEGDL
ncbi:PqqD family peptide modification chaperone [Micromonospora cathayae]|uniref:PqqD family peptide modification chaperone n=1 Tax=Micromonospora cathayae TaxID=3028804 RepID=A0ABY7ZUY2_9ACTN|nr:PqqD family peptide modification chaperone [Micromonospora sp. HUAS 3]WDZ86611.1 PqqD family peptide modification chaperone [Micromonospora sp. HUAS 3]